MHYRHPAKYRNRSQWWIIRIIRYPLTRSKYVLIDCDSCSIALYNNVSVSHIFLFFIKMHEAFYIMPKKMEQIDEYRNFRHLLLNFNYFYTTSFSLKLPTKTTSHPILQGILSYITSNHIRQFHSNITFRHNVCFLVSKRH